jgi:hypothetical protein
MPPRLLISSDVEIKTGSTSGSPWDARRRVANPVKVGGHPTTVFDFAENLIAQQRAFAKQMLRATSMGEHAVPDVAAATPGPTGPTGVTTPDLPGPSPTTTDTSST